VELMRGLAPELGELRFNRVPEGRLKIPSLLPERPLFLSLGAQQLRGTQNKDSQQSHIKGSQHFHLRAVESNRFQRGFSSRKAALR
jgi:hypothetical protein